MIPNDYYARRPLCDAGCYQQLNRKNVDIVDLKSNPIKEFTATGIKTSEGKVHELDVIIFATGFDAVDGNYARVTIEGRNGKTLKNHWADGPSSYLGISVPDFPNLFMITGPNGPFTNLPPTIETHVEFISDIIQRAEKNAVTRLTNGMANQNAGKTMNGTGNINSNYSTMSQVCGHHNGVKKSPVIEALVEAEDGWTTLCDELSAHSLFRKTDSWIFGANVPGKNNSVLFYFGGLVHYREKLKEVIDNGYRGYKPF